MMNELKWRVIEFLQSTQPDFWRSALLRSADFLGLAGTEVEEVCRSLGNLLDLPDHFANGSLVQRISDLVEELERALTRS